ncbi:MULTISPECIES: hypothetical protein [unclassified Leptolyngbya]|uniref:hypothetical protein n=1 Tax=unclassified Leptolyngbya TaxID=2650499 RepID=UPI001685A212|nr:MULTISPECIES: hypothetical protein [unclassified Leptolyngbya]MBD1909086.1 hypothetical protein [Leptolyngbya sp. FACHB-8]MBD2157003.1 hypothetical protein [Leptolyngbya sp. FACHB-16]
MATATATHTIRPELGDFSSIVCFKALVTGTEEALGEKAAAIALIAAGRVRGKQLVQELGMAEKQVSLEELSQILQKALGSEGTRLCIVDRIVDDNNTILVYCRETICSSGEVAGSPRNLTYTLGALQGALEQGLGKRLRGKQIESILRGGTHDVVAFEVIS